MKFKEFLDAGMAADGGTISCRAILDDGTQLDFGLDARIPKTKSQRQIFIGAGYPTEPGARILERSSSEETEFIAAIRNYLDVNCGFLRREALMEIIPSKLNSRDYSDYIAVMFMAAILDRQ